MRFIWQKKKEKTLNIGKIRKYDEDKVFFSTKKRYHLSNLHLYQIGKAQNIPVVAGRLVTITLKLKTICLLGQDSNVLIALLHGVLGPS